MWLVKNALSVVAIFETMAQAVAKRKELNKQYQTNEYYIEEFKKGTN